MHTIFRVYYTGVDSFSSKKEVYEEFNFPANAYTFMNYLLSLDNIEKVHIVTLNSEQKKETVSLNLKDAFVLDTSNIVKICPKTEISYVRISDIPLNEREKLEAWLEGQARPIIEDLDIQDALYSWDYKRWKKNLIKR